MTSEQINKAKSLIDKASKIAIIGHRNPDGDAMGSCLGLYHYLKLKNKELAVIMPNEFPDFLGWIPGADQVLIFESGIEKTTALLQQCDLIFTLDFNAFHRTGTPMSDVLHGLNCEFMMIDHHESPDDYATVCYSVPSMSSTCEMVYRFIDLLGDQALINQNIATCVYTGLITDTGSFKFDSTSSDTLRIAAHLKDTGINTSKIYNDLYDNNSSNRLQLLGKALQNLQVIPNTNVSYISLSQEELDSFNYKKGDTEGIVNYGLSLKGITFTAFFSENKTEGIIKISFRSIGNVDVNEFARKYFNGGGHKNAAGGKSFDSLESTIKQFEQLIISEYAQ